MLLVSLLLFVEARRYRFFDVYRTRVRLFEREYFAELMAPSDAAARDWLAILAEGLRRPVFRIGLLSAVSRRLRRNYIWMYLILLLAWLLKVTSTKLQPDATTLDRLQSLQRVVANAALGPMPGWVVFVAVLLFYLWLVWAAMRPRHRAGEMVYGNVHV